MKKDIIIIGSTGSIGKSTLNVIKNNKNKFKIKLLSTNKNIHKIYNQALEFKVKDIVIFNKDKYLKHEHIFKKKKNKCFF